MIFIAGIGGIWFVGLLAAYKWGYWQGRQDEYMRLKFQPEVTIGKV